MAQTNSFYPVANNPVVIISPQYCVPYPIDLAIVRTVMTIADGSFSFTDANGNLLFKVEEIRRTFVHERKLILDPAGNPIVTLQRKAMTAHSRWQVFRGGSTNPKDLIFNAKKHSILCAKTELDVFLTSNTAEDVCDFQVKGSIRERSCTVYAGDEHSNTVVAQMHNKHTAESILLGNINFMVTVNRNVDYCFIVALIVIFGDINREMRDAAT